MATPIYLTNIDSDISGYKLAMIGSRSPLASTTVSTAVTDLDGTTDLAMTATSGGTAIKWITPQFESDTTIAGSVVFNWWGLESNAAGNASLGVKLFEYTSSEQAVFCQASYGTELGTTVSQIQVSRQPAAVGVVAGGAYTSTVIEAGNRLVIKPFISAVGTMGSGQRVTFDYNGATPGADGDSFILLTESVEADEVQIGDGTQQTIVGGPGNLKLQELVTTMDPVVKAVLSADATWPAIKNELTNLQDVGTS